MYYGKNEITKREVLFSIIIVAVLLIFGLTISGKISDNLLEEYQKYNTAIQINNEQNLFGYSLKTNVGYALIYGDLKAVDAVSYKEVNGEYLFIKKVKERYTKHTSTYTTSDGKGHTKVHTRTYWSWDEIDSEEKHSKQISFINIVFDYGKIPLPFGYDYIDTIKESSRIRYVYYGISKKLTGTIFTFIDNNTISDTEFYEGKTIQETIENLESGYELVLFWIIWIVLIVIIVFAFYYFDNKWLEDK